jgi:hypothetical protein
MMSERPIRFKLNWKVEKKVAIGLIKPLSLLLGVWMLMFGFLKFFPPFSGWFDIQIQQSHLPHEAILAAKLGEMATGILFLLPRSGPPVIPSVVLALGLLTAFLVWSERRRSRADDMLA